MVVPPGEGAQGLVQLAQIPEPQRSILARRQHLVGHVRVVVHVAGAEKVGAVLLEGQLAAPEVPHLEVGVVHRADLVGVVRVCASAAHPLPDLHRREHLEIWATARLKDVKSLGVCHYQVALAMRIPECALHRSQLCLLATTHRGQQLQLCIGRAGVGDLPEPQRRRAIPRGVRQDLAPIGRVDVEQPDLLWVRQGLSTNHLCGVLVKVDDVDLVALLQGASSNHEAVPAVVPARQRRHAACRLPAKVDAGARRLRHG
mmetsp:Transcript_60444/g.153601  ORF Transcript_60444/g.153601 Transcript_60444/m.153601 type:complete len:258 (-) Transcript_60444:92-865(-)